MANEALTPAQRLARSRQALLTELRGDAAPAPAASPPTSIPPAEAAHLLDQVPWAPVARHVARRWWRRHPLNAASQIARPLLGRVAREQPAKLVAAAAAAGALAVLVRPWRLLSVTAVLAAVMKTSDVADLVTTLMQRQTTPRKEP